MHPDLMLAFQLVDAADTETRRRWSAEGHDTMTKGDGTPVTAADIAAEEAMLRALRLSRPADGFLGEEVGEHPGRSGRRWIADGIDGTHHFAAGLETWGTLLALESDGIIVCGVSSSPIQNRRWWAALGGGAFTGPTDRSGAVRLRVSRRNTASPDRVVCLPHFDSLAPERRNTVRQLALGRPADRPWSHQNRVAEGELDLCICYGGDIWDHAAPSIIVEEAGGRFTDHDGGRRLDTRTAVYSNGRNHDEVLSALAADGTGS